MGWSGVRTPSRGTRLPWHGFISLHHSGRWRLALHDLPPPKDALSVSLHGQDAVVQHVLPLSHDGRALPFLCPLQSHRLASIFIVSEIQSPNGMHCNRCHHHMATLHTFFFSLHFLLMTTIMILQHNIHIGYTCAELRNIFLFTSNRVFYYKI